MHEHWTLRMERKDKEENTDVSGKSLFSRNPEGPGKAQSRCRPGYTSGPPGVYFGDSAR